MGRAMRTKGGYCAYECISALQKELRRGNPESAFYWTMELIDSGYGYWALSRILVVIHEDYGIGDVSVGAYCMLSMDTLKEWFKEYMHSRKEAAPGEQMDMEKADPSKRKWELPLVNIILALCGRMETQEKTRLADYFKTSVFYRRAIGELHLEIPDYALDKHTRRGQQMERGVDHFVDEGGQLYTAIYDKEFVEFHKEMAREGWKSGLDIKAYPTKELIETAQAAKKPVKITIPSKPLADKKKALPTMLKAFNRKKG